MLRKAKQKMGKVYLFSAKGAKKLVLNKVEGSYGPLPLDSLLLSLIKTIQILKK